MKKFLWSPIAVRCLLRAYSSSILESLLPANLLTASRAEIDAKVVCAAVLLARMSEQEKSITASCRIPEFYWPYL
jgi:hypothetical protein